MTEATLSKYIYTVGRRKTSKSTVRLFSVAGKSEVNGKAFDKYFYSNVSQLDILSPFKVAELEASKFYFTAKVSGGGVSSQAESVRLGIARAIIELFPEKKQQLKNVGLLTRDPRMVERKKTGFRKARKKEQYSKR